MKKRNNFTQSEILHLSQSQEAEFGRKVSDESSQKAGISGVVDLRARGVRARGSARRQLRVVRACDRVT